MGNCRSGKLERDVRGRRGIGRTLGSESVERWEHDKDPSPIGPGILDVQDGPTRIDAPMVRKSWLESGPGSKNNLRGVDSYIAVSWDEAEKLIADELNRVRNNFGNSSIFGGSYGWASAGTVSYTHLTLPTKA